MARVKYFDPASQTWKYADGIPHDSTKEDKANKVTSISSSSTDTEYPSAKAVKTALDLKANLTDVASPYNFKGSCTYAELPSSGQTLNDTWYVTDRKYRMTWNGTAWYQSSLDESDYEDELDEINGFITENFDIIPSKNLLNPDTLVLGYISGASIVASNEWLTTDFIPIEYGKTYAFSATIISTGERAYRQLWSRTEFDEDKNVLSSASTPGLTVFTPVNEDAKYIRFSFNNVSTTSELCLAEGTSANYIEYKTTYKLKNASNTDATLKVNSAFSDAVYPNLYDKESASDGYILNMAGEIRISGTWRHTDYIPVEYGKSYIFSTNAGTVGTYFVQECDEDKIGVTHNSYGLNPYTPSDQTVKYLRFSYETSLVDEDSAVFCVGTKGNDLYIPFGIYKALGFNSLITNMKNRKWVAVGDSLTEKNVTAISNYTDFIKTYYGMECVNMGVGGTGYRRGIDSNNAFFQRVENVPTDADIITIFGSGNDLGGGNVLGDVTDTTSDTTCGCINITLDVIFDRCPLVPVLIISPTPWGGNTPDMPPASGNMSGYVEKLEQIAKRRGVAYLDLFHHSGLRPDDENQRELVFYNATSVDGNGDYVHPNKIGHSIIAPRIAKAMEKICIFKFD